MAEPKRFGPVSHAEIKAGIFLTLCLALFVAMLFVLGKFGRTWQGTRELHVLFSNVSGLRPEAPVLYNGMELGRVKRITIVHLSTGMLSKLSAIGKHDIENLPLNEEERDQLRSAPDSEIDSQARALLLAKDRSMLMLVLEVSSENDTQRYRVDDEFRVLGTMMGDSFVELRTGNGTTLAQLAAPKVFIGIQGDVYSDLGKSLGQVKDILGSMAELVGGDPGKSSIRGQIVNFEQFTRKLDDFLEPICTKLPETWETADKQIEHNREVLNDVERKVLALEPKIQEATDSVQKSILEMQANTGKSIEHGRERVASIRKEALDGLKEAKRLTSKYKESVPAQIKSAHEQFDRFEPWGRKLESILSRTREDLDKGGESTRSAMKGYLEMGENLEAMMFRFKTWPGSFANTPEPEVLASRELVWRTDRAHREYAELRDELERVRRSISPTESTDKARLQRIDEIMRDSDSFLEIDGARPFPDKQKGKN